MGPATWQNGRQHANLLQVPRLLASVLAAPKPSCLLAALALAAALESAAAVLLRPFLGDVPQLVLR